LRRANAPLVPLPSTAPSTAIFPNNKTARRVFDFEVQIFHDLSTLLTPQFHTQDTIDFHTLTMRDDLLTNDLTVCVSEATKSDVLRYLKPPKPERVIAIHLGFAWLDLYEESHRALIDAPEFQNALVEPYVLILGTVEPRKNIGVVLEFLQRSPRILDLFRFVFVGRRGWGEQFEAHLDRYGVKPAYEQGRIIFTGFIPEQNKYSLMKEAKLVVYPSLFEGFGLPVLEALSLGVPVVTTYGSSLPEIGGDACYYFDPFAEKGLDAAFMTAILELEANPTSIRSRARSQAQQFSWSGFYRRLRESMADLSKSTVIS
jgi:glycosyltransferase involved in cell wall biosynthesis